ISFLIHLHLPVKFIHKPLLPFFAKIKSVMQDLQRDQSYCFAGRPDCRLCLGFLAHIDHGRVDSFSALWNVFLHFPSLLLEIFSSSRTVSCRSISISAWYFSLSSPARSTRRFHAS